MTAEVRKHCVLNAVLAVEASEYQTEAAVQQETAENDREAETAEQGDCSWQMSCGKE